LYARLLQLLVKDKILHFLFGVVVSLPVGAIMPTAASAFLAALATAFVVGALKEIVDALDNRRMQRPEHGVEFMDAIATALGGLYAGAFLWVSLSKY
jgi:hypothetical protein